MTIDGGAQRPNPLDDYKSGLHWAKTEVALRGGAYNRVLVMGPGPASDLDHITEYSIGVLRKNGIRPERIARAPDVKEEIEEAIGWPCVLCIAITVGTASETLLLLNRINDEVAQRRDAQRDDEWSPPQIIVLVEERNKEGHFARAVADVFGTTVVSCPNCDSLDEAEFGAVVLQRVASAILAYHGGRDSRSASITTRSRLDAAARRAEAEERTDGIEQVANQGENAQQSVRRHKYMPILVFTAVFVGIAALAAILLVRHTVNVEVFVPLIMLDIVLLIVLVAAFLRINDYISEANASKILVTALDKVVAVVPGLKEKETSD